MSVSCAPMCPLSLIPDPVTQHPAAASSTARLSMWPPVKCTVWAETDLLHWQSSLNSKISIYIITAHTITIYIILYTYEPSAGLLPTVQGLFIPFRSDRQTGGHTTLEDHEPLHPSVHQGIVFSAPACPCLPSLIPNPPTPPALDLKPKLVQTLLNMLACGILSSFLLFFPSSFNSMA